MGSITVVCRGPKARDGGDLVLPRSRRCSPRGCPGHPAAPVARWPRAVRSAAPVVMFAGMLDAVADGRPGLGHATCLFIWAWAVHPRSSLRLASSRSSTWS